MHRTHSQNDQFQESRNAAKTEEAKIVILK